MIPLSALPVKFYKGRIIPRFLSSYEKYKIESVIELYESLLGSEFDEELIKRTLEEFFKDFRIAKAIYYVMRYFYETKGKVESLGGYNPFELRRKFYEWVGRNYGFIKREEWEEVVKKFCHEVGLDFKAFREFLESDLPKNRILVRKRDKPTPEKIIGLYNFLILEKLLSISEYAELRYFGEYKGRMVKELILKAKHHDVIAEFYKRNNYLEIRITGPHQIFKLPAVSEYGKHIAAIISPILTTYEEWRLFVSVVHRKRKAYFVLTGYSDNSPPLLPYWRIDSSDIPKEIFDSSVEERINRLFLASLADKGFRILRESDVLILKSGKIMIPDFTIEKGRNKVFIEVIGYWREKYIESKVRKLNEVVEEGYKIIGIADHRLRGKLKDVKAPIFYYDSTHIPFGRIYKKIIELIEV